MSSSGPMNTHRRAGCPTICSSENCFCVVLFQRLIKSSWLNLQGRNAYIGGPYIPQDGAVVPRYLHGKHTPRSARWESCGPQPCLVESPRFQSGLLKDLPAHAPCSYSTYPTTPSLSSVSFATMSHKGKNSAAKGKKPAKSGAEGKGEDVLQAVVCDMAGFFFQHLDSILSSVLTFCST